MPCDVCHEGTYAIINRYGQHLYDIECPECFGTCMTDDEADAAAQASADKSNYEAAMQAMRAAQGIVTATADETRSGSVERSEIEPGPVRDAPNSPHQGPSHDPE